MAWVTQDFTLGFFTVSLQEKEIFISGASKGERFIGLHPRTLEDAQGYALMLRRAAKRLEEIGSSLPDRATVEAADELHKPKRLF